MHDDGEKKAQGDGMQCTIAMLEKEMRKAAAAMNFEDAARLRDAINALKQGTGGQSTIGTMKLSPQEHRSSPQVRLTSSSPQGHLTSSPTSGLTQLFAGGF